MILKNILRCSVLSLVVSNALCAAIVQEDVKPAEAVVVSQVKSPSAQEPLSYENLCPDLKLMKMLLGDEFKPLPDGLKDNITAFFTKFNPGQFQSFCAQHVDLDEELTGFLCNLIEREQSQWNNGKVTLYHGCDGKMLFLYRYYARLFHHLTGKDFGNYVLRGDCLYARNPDTGETYETVRDVRKACSATGGSDYDRGIDVSTLHCNIGLSVGPGVSLSTASAVGFWCNSFNAYKQAINRLIRPSLIFQGMSKAQADESAKEVQELCKKYFLEDNGGLLAISLPIGTADRLALHVCMWGAEYDPKIATMFKETTGQQVPSFLLCDISRNISSATSVDDIVNSMPVIPDETRKGPFAEKLHDYLQTRSDGYSSIKTLLSNVTEASHREGLTREDISSLTNEIILYLHPELYKTADIFGMFRHPLEKESELESQIDELAQKHADQLQKLVPFDDTFRALGIPTKCSNLTDVIYELFARGEFAAAQKIIADNPEIFPNIDAKLLFGATLKALKNGWSDNAIEHLKRLDSVEFDNKELILLSSLFLNTGPEPRREMFQYFAQQDLDKETFVQLIASFQHAAIQNNPMTSMVGEKDLLEESLLRRQEQKGDAVGIMRQVFFSMNPRYMSPQAIETFTKLGLSFNPGDREGLLEIGRKNPMLLPSIKAILPADDADDKGMELAGETTSYQFWWDCIIAFENKRVPLPFAEMKEIIEKWELKDQLQYVGLLLKSDNESFRSFGDELSNEVVDPITSKTLKEILQLIKDYGLEEDFF